MAFNASLGFFAQVTSNRSGGQFWPGAEALERLDFGNDSTFVFGVMMALMPSAIEGSSSTRRIRQLYSGGASGCCCSFCVVADLFAAELMPHLPSLQVSLQTLR